MSAPQAPTILMVDDDPVMLQFAKTLGRRYLFNILGTTNIAQACEIASTQAIDAAIIDVHLNGQENGFSLARRLREMPQLAQLPICFLSGDATLEARIQAGQSGADFYMAKTTDDEALVTTLQQLIAMRSLDEPRTLIICEQPEQVRLDIAPDDLGAIEIVEDKSDVLEQLAHHRPDALVLAPESFERAQSLCLAVRTVPQWRELPVVLATRNWDGGRHRVAAARVRADDCVGLPFDPEELRDLLNLRIQRARQLRADAQVDALTGLFRRQSFLYATARIMEEARRTSQPLTLALIDLDHFKKINDQHGHLAGDRVLQGFGHLLKAKLRPEDIRGRWGGEEFCIAFPRSGAPAALAVLERLLADFRATEFAAEDGQSFMASFSAGLAEFPQDHREIRELMSMADERLYQAKVRGRSRVIAPPSPPY